VRDGINEPRGIQDHIPLIVGGNGRVRTAGLAVRFADELNLVFVSPEETAERMAEVRARCEAAGRDPASLRFSVYVRDEDVRRAGQARVDLIGAYRDVGLDRIVCFPTKGDPTVEAQAAFAQDCLAAGIELDGPAG
jgi:alkanesulfonate monooxygenase SsuD/methylene tetrahydromethanopterin reductase-like flavin-dependent oxidoreductase (luciferase family)